MTRQRAPSFPGGYRGVVEEAPPLPPPPPRGPTLETRVAVIEQKLDTLEEQSEKRHADVIERLTKGEQSSRHETTKIIVTAVVAVLTSVIGGKAIEKDPPAPQVRAVRSSFEIELDGCKILEGQAKADCVTKAIEKHAAR